MPLRYRSARELTSQQRARVTRVLSGAMAIRWFIPALGIWWAFILAGLAVTRRVSPEVDPEDWAFIAAFFPASCLVFAAAMVVGYVRLVRWLINYRTQRRGRLVALREVLRPSDARPSRWRRWWLSRYGVTDADLALVPSLWCPIEH